VLTFYVFIPIFICCFLFSVWLYLHLSTSDNVCDNTCICMFGVAILIGAMSFLAA